MGLSDILGSVGGWLKTNAPKAIDYAKKNPDTILAGAGIVKGALDQRSAGKRRDAAVGRVRGEHDAKAPLRQMAVQQLLAAQRPRDLSALFADPGNPYARRR